jgi:hypothetical protein
MRTLAVVAALPLAIVGWQWWSDRSTERLLSPIASEAAGRSVEVDCQSLWANLIDALPRHGEVLFDANGVPEGRIFLTHPTCDRLQSFAGRTYHRQLACLHRIDWQVPVPLLPGSDCYEDVAQTVYAVMTLTHEAYHTAGEVDEVRTNCFAIQGMAYTAVRLGAARREAELLALAMAALEPFQAGGYGTDRCRAGTELDLHPETPAFPTEQPIAAPRGYRGGRT